MSDPLLRRSFEAADRVARRLSNSIGRNGRLFPVDADRLAGMSDEEREPLESFLKRFEQLQDSIDRRLLRLVLEALGESPETARDRAELGIRYGLIVSLDDWVAAGVLRNKLAHDYPLEEGVQVERLNAAWALAETPLVVLARCHELATRDPVLVAALGVLDQDE